MELLRHFSWIIAGKLFAFITTVLLVKILTNSMSVGQYGELMLGLTLFNLLTQVVMAPFGQGIGRVYVTARKYNAIFDFKNSAFEIYKKIAIYSLFSLLAFVLIAAPFVDYRLIIFVSIIIVYSYLFGANDILSSLQNMAKNRKEFALSIIVEQLIKLCAIYVLSIYMNLNPQTTIIGYMVATAVALVYHKLTIAKLSENSEDKRATNNKRHWDRRIYQVAGPAAVWGVGVWMQQASDKWALQLFEKKESVALYSALYQISYAPILMALGLVMTLFMPVIFAERNYKKVLAKLIMLNFSICLISIVAMNYAGEIVVLKLLGPNYESVSRYIPYMLLAAGLYQAGDIASQALMRKFKPNQIMKVKLVTSMLCAMQHMVAANYYGTTGVVVSLLIFGIIYFSSFSYYAFYR